MRTTVPAVVLAALVVGGCCTTPPPEIIGPSWDSPEQSFRTFRAAVLAKRPDLIYDSFSPGFKQDFGVPDRREFRAGYEAHAAEFDRIARAFADARIVSVDRGTDERSGLDWARVRVEAGDMTGSFILVEIPTAHLLVAIPGYDPQPADYYVPGPGFGGHVTVSDGVVRVAIDAAEAGVAAPEELKELRFSGQWLLRDIRELPVNVRKIIESMRPSASRP